MSLLPAIFRCSLKSSHARLARSFYTCGSYCGLHCVGDVYDTLDMAMIHALAHSVTVVGASWSRSQEWLSCTRVLWDWLHNPQPVRAPSANDCVAKEQCAPLQGRRLRSDMEQPAHVGGYGRLSGNQSVNSAWL